MTHEKKDHGFKGDADKASGNTTGISAGGHPGGLTKDELAERAERIQTAEHQRTPGFKADSTVVGTKPAGENKDGDPVDAAGDVIRDVPVDQAAENKTKANSDGTANASDERFPSSLYSSSYKGSQPPAYPPATSAPGYSVHKPENEKTAEDKAIENDAAEAKRKIDSDTNKKLGEQHAKDKKEAKADLKRKQDLKKKSDAEALKKAEKDSKDSGNVV